MALIIRFNQLHKDRNQIHGPVECGYTMFEKGGQRYLQLDTYGSSERQIPGKTSQSIQLNVESARQLKALIQKTFLELA